VRLRMSSPVWGRVEFFADSGGGFSGAECFERVDCRGTLALDVFAHFPRPVRAVRFDPLDRAGEFRLDSFRVEPVPRPRLFLHGLRRRWQSGAGLPRSSYQRPGGSNIDATYEAWRHGKRLTDAERTRLRAGATTPLISILLPVGRGSAADVRRSVASVNGQIGGRWDLHVVGG